MNGISTADEVSSSVASGSGSDPALRVVEPPERLQRLVEQHQQWLAKIARKKREFARFEADVRGYHGEVGSRAQPLIEQLGGADRAIHDAFGEILARKKLRRRDRDAVEGLYRSLQLEGVVSPRDLLDELLSDWPLEWDADADARAEFDPRDGGARSDRDADPAAGEWQGGEHRGRGADRSIRDLFRELAVALHPDRVRDEQEREARTEAMKEVNRAYREGDLARLLELESEWQGGGSPGDPAQSEDEIERRCRVLVRKNDLLEQQYATLLCELRQLRRSAEGQLVIDYRRLVRQREPDPAEAMLAPLRQEVERSTQIRDFVHAFRDGDISLAEFLVGPPIHAANDLDADDLDDDLDADDLDDDTPDDLQHALGLMMALLDDLVADVDFDPSPRSRKRKRKRKRKNRRRKRG